MLSSRSFRDVEEALRAELEGRFKVLIVKISCPGVLGVLKQRILAEVQLCLIIEGQKKLIRALTIKKVVPAGIRAPL